MKVSEHCDQRDTASPVPATGRTHLSLLGMAPHHGAAPGRDCELLSPCQVQTLVPRPRHVAAFLSGHLPGLGRELRRHPRAAPHRDPSLSHLGIWDLGSEAPHEVTASVRWNEPFKVTPHTGGLAGESQWTGHPPPCEVVTPQPHGLPSSTTPAPTWRQSTPTLLDGNP